MAKLPDHVKRLLDSNLIVHLATVNPDGSPQVSPIWIERDGDRLRFSTAEGRVKVRNLRRDPRLALSFTDRQDSGKMVAIQGRATAIEQRGWDLIDRLARRYDGTEGFPRIQGMTRVDVDIEVERITS
jgi:PPOX class probable F420-dependent enzyme